jgi:hypothetical protein
VIHFIQDIAAAEKERLLGAFRAESDQVRA